MGVFEVIENLTVANLHPPANNPQRVGGIGGLS